MSCVRFAASLFLAGLRPAPALRAGRIESRPSDSPEANEMWGSPESPPASDAGERWFESSRLDGVPWRSSGKSQGRMLVSSLEERWPNGKAPVSKTGEAG